MVCRPLVGNPCIRPLSRRSFPAGLLPPADHRWCGLGFLLERRPGTLHLSAGLSPGGSGGLMGQRSVGSVRTAVTEEKHSHRVLRPWCLRAGVGLAVCLAHRVLSPPSWVWGMQSAWLTGDLRAPTWVWGPGCRSVHRGSECPQSEGWGLAVWLAHWVSESLCGQSLER